MTHGNIYSTLATSLLYKTGAALATTSSSRLVAQNTVTMVLAFSQSLIKNGDLHVATVAYELILGASWPDQLQ